VTGHVPSTIGMTYTTDARFVRNQGHIPAIVLGPGSIAQAHGIDEWVEISQLVDATAIYAEIYRSFGPGWSAS
jgi:acetylornithine deacetylase/succinyl-diaminopimelate desuccinylase-like protein